MADTKNSSFWASKSRQEKVLDITLFIITWTSAIVFLFPFFWMISTSLKDPAEVGKMTTSGDTQSQEEREKGNINTTGAGGVGGINMLPIKKITAYISEPQIAQYSGKVRIKENEAEGTYVVEYYQGKELVYTSNDVPLGAKLLIKDKQKVEEGQDISVLPSKGRVKFVMEEGKVKFVKLVDDKGRLIARNPITILPFSRMEVKDGQEVSDGQLIATAFPQWQNYAKAWLSSDVKKEYGPYDFFQMNGRDVVASLDVQGKASYAVQKDGTTIVSIFDPANARVANVRLPEDSKMLVKTGDAVTNGTRLATLPMIGSFKDPWIADSLKKKSIGARIWEELTIESGSFTRFFLNTVLITVLTILAIMFSSTFVAYGFARFKFPFRDQLFMILVATMMIPTQVTMIPAFIIFTELGWVNTYLPLIIPLIFGGSAFNIFLMRQFFMSIPYELDDAAKIDGCNYFQIFTIILLPLVKPALVTVAIFSFVWTWNDFFGPLIYLKSPANIKTLAVGLADFNTKSGSNYAYLMAASLVMLVPVLLVFFIGQKYFIEGIATSGLKG